MSIVAMLIEVSVLYKARELQACDLQFIAEVLVATIKDAPIICDSNNAWHCFIGQTLL